MNEYNSSTLETETGGSKVRGQSGIHSETLSQKKKKRSKVRNKKNL
jgi:hypothetical protein